MTLSHRTSQDSQYDDQDEDEKRAVAFEFETEQDDLPLSTAKLLALTCTAGGLQLIWSTIFSNGSAYLFSLGITKSQSSLVWAVAPICGTLIQPLVGALSDNSRSRYGKRRPFIVCGALGVVVSLLSLSFVERLTSKLVTPSAVFTIVLLNIAIQPLQSGFRALVVDVCPSDQQAKATAWASRFTGLGNILGYLAGSVRLPESLLKHEAVRFRYLAVLSSIMLGATVLITIFSVRESGEQDELYDASSGEHYSLSAIWRRTMSGIREMPSGARWVCKVQFLSWMAWFAFLFYSSTYIGELYLQEEGAKGSKSSTLHSNSIAIGSTANLLFASVSFVASIILPVFAGASRHHRTPIEQSSGTHGRTQTSLGRLVMMWALSNVLYTVCALSTFFVTSTSVGMLIVATVGLSWAVTQWVPFALIFTEISVHQGPQRSATWTERGSRESGVMLGIHNAAMSLPQILAALLSSAIFWIVSETGRGKGAVGWVLGSSAFASLCAAWMVYQRAR